MCVSRVVFSSSTRQKTERVEQNVSEFTLKLGFIPTYFVIIAVEANVQRHSLGCGSKT